MEVYNRFIIILSIIGVLFVGAHHYFKQDYEKDYTKQSIALLETNRKIAGEMNANILTRLVVRDVKEIKTILQEK